MSTKAKPIPDGYHTVTPYLVVPGVPKLLGFLQQAFGAVITERHDAPDGSVMHAQVRIGDSLVMLGESGPRPPIPACLYLYVEDADATYQRAMRAGAISLQEPMDQFYGDRHGGVKDASGNTWWIATHKEDVSKEEMARRAQAHFEKQAGGKK